MKSTVIRALAVAGIIAIVSAPLVEAQVSIYNKNAVAKQFTVVNSGTAAADHAYLEAKVSGTTGGDPHTRYTIPGGTSWYSGVDNSASDVYDIGTSTAVGSARYFEIVSGANTVMRWGPDGAGQTIITAGNGGGQIITLSGSGTGATLTLGSTLASTVLALRAANVSYMNLTADGRWYGTALHNNAGAVTGTTNQYMASGTYTPTLSNTTNVAASTARKCQWIRVGNVVSVSGSADIDPTAAAATLMGISLPIASNLALATDCGGTAAGDQAAAIEAAAVRGDATNDRCEFSYTAVNIANHTIFFHFQYEVL